MYSVHHGGVVSEMVVIMVTIDGGYVEQVLSLTWTYFHSIRCEKLSDRYVVAGMVKETRWIVYE